MTYSVKWTPTNVTFARRFDVYLDYPFFEHQVDINLDGSLPFSAHQFIFHLASTFLFLTKYHFFNIAECCIVCCLITSSLPFLALIVWPY